MSNDEFLDLARAVVPLAHDVQATVRDITDPLHAEISTLREENAKLREERDALAAALNKRDEEWCYVLESIRKEMKSGRDFNGNPFLAAASRMTMKPLPDVHAILAARDKRQQALGAAKWIEWYRDHQALEYEREYLDGHAGAKRMEAVE